MFKRLLYALSIGLLLSLYGFSTCPVRDTGRVEIRIMPMMNGRPLVLSDALYHTATGDSLQIDVLRFYISGVQLLGQNGVVFTEQNSYHLIDAEDNSTFMFILNNVPSGSYESIRFTIGTDSMANVSGALGGDLDPTKGMYWAWNTGYINIKVEGRSDACKTMHHAFEFHLGGYMPPYQTVQQLELPLSPLNITAYGNASIPLVANLDRFFAPIHLSDLNSVLIPSRTAASLAGSFKNIFK